ncbi:cellulase family glycosylhydrolase [Nocardiopsis alkaliphila]|uniref:cellulase family glycosylhydrolase n=1 Tax=Nocardiopsis alkaliphila TaxID=225762 RepID=UPI00034BEADF|nr:cellulase family glycosylhydrolase [Nocardiopsis alkaliphila]
MIRNVLLAVGSVLALVLSFATVSLPAHADSGFRVVDGRLVDAGGNDFVLRGVSHAHTWFTHQDQSITDISALGANAVRVVLSSGDRWDENDVSEVTEVVADCKANRVICMLEVHDTTGYGEDAEAATLDQAVDYWLRIQEAVQGEEDYVLVNIGNEPYGNDEATNRNWAADTADAINRLRDAGFTHTLVVDAPNWGQDWQGIMREEAAEVFAADPDANTVFSIHMYGVYEQESVIVDYLESFVDAGLPLVIGEFGHFHSDGDPDEDAIMAHAERLGLGYIGWSWSGNSGGVDYLDMAIDFDPANLSEWGERIFHGPNGIAQTAVRAPIFDGPAPEPTEQPTEQPTEGPTEPSDDCTAQYSVVGSWGSGHQAEVTITAGTALEAWTVTWELPAGESVNQSWGARVTTSGGTVTATNAAYNGALAQGESTSFGLIGSSQGDPLIPEPVCAAL